MPGRTTRWSRETDVIVLGGGIIGAAIARELARAGQAVRLLDAGGVGSGTSSRCDGNLLVQTKHDDLGVALMLRSLAGYRRWSTELDRDIALQRHGSLVFFTGDGTVAAGDRVGWLEQTGVRAELLTPAQVQERQPGLCAEVSAGIDCYDDSSVYPPAVVAALISDAVAYGCVVEQRVRADTLLTDSTGHAFGVRTDQGEVYAPWIVNAMGAWSAAFDTGERDPLPIEPRQGVLVVTEPAAGLVPRPVTEAAYISDRASAGTGSTAQVSLVAEPTYRGNILLGSSRRFCGFDTDVPYELMEAIVRHARDLLPALGGLRVIRSFAGLRPWSPDNRPIVGESVRIPGYVHASGHEGEGIGLAAVTAEMVRTDVLKEQPDDLLERGMAAWSPHRLDATVASTA